MGSITTLPDNKAVNPKGGRLFLIGDISLENISIYNSVWISANAERNGSTWNSMNGGLSYAGSYGHLWFADDAGFCLGFHPNQIQVTKYNSPSFGWPVRCIQK